MRVAARARQASAGRPRCRHGFGRRLRAACARGIGALVAAAERMYEFGVRSTESYKGFANTIITTRSMSAPNQRAASAYESESC